MNSVYIFVAIAFCGLQLAHGEIVENTADRSFELHAGNCSKAVASDIVFQDHLRLFAIPFVHRSGLSSWYGNEKIYCILALSARDESEGSTVSIKDGGLGQYRVTLEMVSEVNHGLEYNIVVYGK
ncbi:unnamed protein product [Phaedon cochleariae]|uniref:Uncharacterized protein n=1 Tax=Phaedon cochleariae TaxID=80249 RepID=A0A9P0DA79_PHACE|nr:unnamed protein product [Phaedon cochleariae]